MNEVNRLTYSHTRLFEVWNRCAPYRCAPRSRSPDRLAVGVAADVRPPVDHRDLQPQLRGAPLGDGQTEEPSSHHDQICAHDPHPTVSGMPDKKLTVIVEQCLAPVPGGTGRYATQITAALAASAPAGWQVRTVTAWHRDLTRARIDGADGPHRLPAGHRVLNQLWRRGLPPTVRGTAVHATTPLAPGSAGQRRGDRARRGALDASGDPQSAGGGLAPGHGGPLDAAGQGDRGPVAGGGR